MAPPEPVESAQIGPPPESALSPGARRSSQLPSDPRPRPAGRGHDRMPRLLPLVDRTSRSRSTRRSPGAGALARRAHRQAPAHAGRGVATCDARPGGVRRRAPARQPGAALRGAPAGGAGRVLRLRRDRRVVARRGHGARARTRTWRSPRSRSSATPTRAGCATDWRQRRAHRDVAGPGAGRRAAGHHTAAHRPRPGPAARTATRPSPRSTPSCISVSSRTRSSWPPSTGSPGSGACVQLRWLVSIADGRAESAGESALRLRWYDAGLPRPQLQISVFRNGVEIFRLDLGLEELLFAAEYDGVDFHTSARAARTRRRPPLRAPRAAPLGPRGLRPHQRLRTAAGRRDPAPLRLARGPVDPG